jgi:hypothetical protein
MVEIEIQKQLEAGAEPTLPVEAKAASVSFASAEETAKAEWKQMVILTLKLLLQL